MSVRIKTTPRGFDEVRRVLNKVAWLDIEKLLDDVGAVIESQVRRRIIEQEGPPEGGDWKEYDPQYREWKSAQGKLVGKGKGFLLLEGHLEDSIQRVVRGGAVEIGSNLQYAGPNQATRPFLGLSDENQDEVEHATTDWLREVMGL